MKQPDSYGPQGPLACDAPERPLVAILGATGTGKSSLALNVAEALGGEIVNCDSLQVFRHFDIGTAKLPVSDRRGIPHHLIDIVNPDEIFTAGEYSRRARETIAGISARGRLPVVCGGTGFYFRALVAGLFEGPERDAALRERLGAREKRRPGSLHRLLSRFDRDAAGRIHPHDVPKVMRALEVCLLAQRPVSALFRDGRNALRGYRTIRFVLQPDRERLYQRLDARCRQMFQGGLIDEVRHILSLGYPPSAKPFESHGYKQVLQLLGGELTLEGALELAQRNTRRYAKRQMTWFRQEPGVEWVPNFGDDAAVVQDVLVRVAGF
ncbi:MAG TPA: tRNA (adenosine(37)-N6)-dimethylallyltransferase MiaA [Bryobacteraceae bacterium]